MIKNLTAPKDSIDKILFDLLNIILEEIKLNSYDENIDDLNCSSFNEITKLKDRLRKIKSEEKK